MDSPGLTGDPVRPSETSFFHLPIQSFLECRPSSSWLQDGLLSLQALCPGSRERGKMAKGEVHASPGCPLRNRLPNCCAQLFLLLAHGPELCQMGGWVHFSSK